MAVVLVHCPECRADNATGARSCIVCLHPLPGADDAATSVPSPTVTRRGERETIALAFLDDGLRRGDDGDGDRGTDAATICTAVFAVLVVVACLLTVCWPLVAS